MLLQGCGTFSLFDSEEDKPITKMVALHALAGEGRTDAMNMTVKSRNGTEVILERMPLIDSSRFRKIEAVPLKDGNCYLKVFFDKHAKIRWQSISAHNNGSAVAVLVDGKPVTWWRVSAMPRAAEFVIVERKFPRQLAEEISEAAENNYKKLNPRNLLD